MYRIGAKSSVELNILSVAPRQLDYIVVRSTIGTLGMYISYISYIVRTLGILSDYMERTKLEKALSRCSQSLHLA